ncbi:hypothetical protein BD414DRAFT_493130 [Trametes punicea]|nr:hypothetical protein BD414DRAFT_493130 [Trametes punicea]
MSKVEISKAELALWGVEHLAKLKKQTGLLKSTREHIATTARKAAGTLPEKHDRDDSGWKREILEGRKSRQGQRAGSHNAADDHGEDT